MKLKKMVTYFSIFPLIILLCLTFSCQQQVEEGITEAGSMSTFISADISTDSPNEISISAPNSKDN